jgi:two-component system response regulator AtoC
MQLDGHQLLFYLDALYEFANEISKRRSIEGILEGMLSIVTGTFGITKGMVLICYAGDPTFELITYQNLESPTIERISQQLHADIKDDFRQVSGLVELSCPPGSPSAPATLRELMASAGMTMVIVLRTQERLASYIGLGSRLLDTPFSEHQIELLSALTTHTEIALGNALFYQDILQENQRLKEALQKQYEFDNMVGQSASMQQIYQRIQQIASYPNYSVLISGESGTGKELIARAIHHHSPRKDRMFLAINCVALPQELVESELFGYEKGAFTGANMAKPGLFEVAEGGTLFLDEIAEMPTATQAKLLRTLEQKEVMRIGGSTVRPVDVRVIAATNRDLRKAIADGQLRDDLFYRFDAQIYTPPLRDRKEDIPLLVDVLLKEIAEESQQSPRAMSSEGLRALMDYDWPGNVRELKKVLMQAAMATEDTVVRPKDMPLPQDEVQTVAQAGLSLKDSVERLKRLIIEKALDDCNGNKTKAAAQLGMTRQNLQNIMRRMNIT